MTPVAALCTSARSGPELRDLADDALRRDVAADEDRLCALRAQLLRGLLGGLVVSEVADADAGRAEVREPVGDRLPDSARAARHEDGGALHAHSRLQRLVGRRGARNLLPAGPGARLARPFLGLGGRVAEPVEELGLLLGVAANLVVLRQVLDELEDARAQLVGEVRRRGPDDRVDVVLGRLGHRLKANR